MPAAILKSTRLSRNGLGPLRFGIVLKTNRTIFFANSFRSIHCCGEERWLRLEHPLKATCQQNTLPPASHGDFCDQVYAENPMILADPMGMKVIESLDSISRSLHS